jgi:hypothetical protein
MQVRFLGKSLGEICWGAKTGKVDDDGELEVDGDEEDRG